MDRVRPVLREELVAVPAFIHQRLPPCPRPAPCPGSIGPAVNPAGGRRATIRKQEFRIHRWWPGAAGWLAVRRRFSAQPGYELGAEVPLPGRVPGTRRARGDQRTDGTRRAYSAADPGQAMTARA